MKQDILSPDFLDHFHEKVHEPIRATPVNLPTINKVSRGPGGGIGIHGFTCISGNPSSGKSALALGFASSALNYGIEGGCSDDQFRDVSRSDSYQNVCFAH